MTGLGAALIVSAIVLGGLAGPVLGRSRWPVARPSTAIICWVGVLAGTVAALTSLIVLVLLSPPAPAHGLLELLHGCLPEHKHPGVAEASAVSVGLMGICCARLARGLPRLLRAVLDRRRHREMLRLVAHADDEHADVLVIDHPMPVAYCLPARHYPIVVSTGARASLTMTELDAVLAHERAHLRRRHHLLMLLLDLAYALTPWLPTVRRARVCLPPLLEMAADDVAARSCGHHILSAALRRMTVPRTGPAGVLSAAGPAEDALTYRLARLESAAADVHIAATALAWITAVGTVTSPLALAALAVTAIPLPC